MNGQRLVTGMLMFALWPAGAALAAKADTAPQKVIETAANRVLQAIDGRRDELRDNPEELYGIVEDILLPHFDTEYASRLVLARSYRQASEDQRERFQEAMADSLVRTYADGLLELTADTMEVLPLREKPDGDRVTVATEITLEDGTKAPVNYVMHRVNGEWKVFDVYIEGISYVLNYRKQLGAEIRQAGLEQVIERLEKDPEAIEAVTPGADDS
ncbi:ABC transporter substrate-binding protein [soil metagenome]